MLIYSMSVSVDGFIADREGAFGWTVPSEDRTLDGVQTMPALPKGRWPTRSLRRSPRPTGTSRSADGLAASAIELGLVDELRMFRYPVVVGGGTPFLPPVTEVVPL